MEHEFGLTALFNDYLAGVANAILGLFHITAEHPHRPWENWIVMELLVVALIMIAAAVLRSSLSVDKPGTIQHLFEVLHGFFQETLDQVGVHHSEKYLPYIGTIFIFILSMNLIGLVPAFESPTMAPWVPAGLAVVTFLYFNFVGLRENGLGYLAHFAGPVRFPNPIANIAVILFLVPIEVISVCIRPLSLTVRLYGNMFAGEQVTNVFLDLTKLVIPVIFMGLHVFVALVQAYVFFLLTTIYIAEAVHHQEAGHHGEGPALMG
jgi:F-type H+-transporting ATPase subunit a